ncbi:MAG TPA: acyl-CoA thioester hydrolase/BAAT C-terminal domain-containing protein [Iamia sp.]|nr:acyl-CoA thioester hydrolase/BAAT C-terminal domain-containing protein [Iamia sp.]
MAGRQRVGWVAVALVASTLACSSDGGGGEQDAGERAGEATIVVTPAVALADEPLEVTIEGLPADTDATLVVTSTDDAGRVWTDEAEVRVEADGTVDPGAATQATTDLLATLRPDDDEDGLYHWSRDELTFSVEVRGADDAQASAEIERSIVDDGVQDRPTTLEDEGFVGHLWSPEAVPAEPVPGVVLIGGSEGGLGGLFEAPLLASHGYPALQLGLFELPGLPDDLRSIPLEMIADALRWLGQQPGVDPDRLWVRGGSRGSEAALLVGAHFPDLVAGVVATVPSSAVNCAFPDCEGSAWTLAGDPLPYSSRSDEIPPEAVIPVERIDGPVITTCGGRDSLWDSCAFARLITARRGAAGTDDVSISRARAGHGVGLIAPQVVAGDIPAFAGGEPIADEQARVEAWAAFLEALDA